MPRRCVINYKLTQDVWSKVRAVMEAEGADVSGAMGDAIKMAVHTGTLSLTSMETVITLRQLLEQNLKSNTSLRDESRKALRRAIPALYSQSK